MGNGESIVPPLPPPNIAYSAVVASFSFLLSPLPLPSPSLSLSLSPKAPPPLSTFPTTSLHYWTRWFISLLIYCSSSVVCRRFPVLQLCRNLHCVREGDDSTPECFREHRMKLGREFPRLCLCFSNLIRHCYCSCWVSNLFLDDGLSLFSFSSWKNDHYEFIIPFFLQRSVDYAENYPFY